MLTLPYSTNGIISNGAEATSEFAAFSRVSKPSLGFAGVSYLSSLSLLWPSSFLRILGVVEADLPLPLLTKTLVKPGQPQRLLLLPSLGIPLPKAYRLPKLRGPNKTHSPRLVQLCTQRQYRSSRGNRCLGTWFNIAKIYPNLIIFFFLLINFMRSVLCGIR